MKKPQLTIRTTLLIIIGILNILIAALVATNTYRVWGNFKQAKLLSQDSNIIDAFYDANKNLSLERGMSFSILYVGSETAEFLQEDLAKSRKGADAALEKALGSLTATKHEAAKLEIEKKYEVLKNWRIALDQALDQPLENRDYQVTDQIFKSSISLVSTIQNFILVSSRSYQGIQAAISRQMMFKYFVWELAENEGKEYALIGRMIAENKYPLPEQQEQLMLLRGRIKYGWEILHKFSISEALAENLLPFMKEAETQYFLTFDQISGLFYGPQAHAADASYPITIEMWLGMASQAVDSLLLLQDSVLNETKNNVHLIEADARKEIFASIFIFICALALSLYCGSLIVFRIARPINAMVDTLFKATREEVYEMPKISYRHDEIGKLAQVLEVFQDNTRKIKQSNEELERFAYIAAHDLKSPLRAVDNISQWLEEDLGDILPEKDKKYMEELRRRIRHMDKLLDDTLEYARIGAKMEPQSDETITGETLIKEIVELLEFPKMFSVKIGTQLSKFQLHKLPLQQVFYNLINNALKHHDKPNGTIEVDGFDGKTEYIFTVRDDGPGIERQYHQKIFEMFQTLQPRDKSKGRGMGLAMVRRIVTTHGGDITIESEPGKGTLFRFTWPKPHME